MSATAGTPKGTGMRGVLDYDLDKVGARIVGGNLMGQTARELAAEFGITRAKRPRYRKCVRNTWVSISDDDRHRFMADPELAGKLAERYMELAVLQYAPAGKSGVGECPWVAILHPFHDPKKDPRKNPDDAKYHLHIPWLSITFDGRPIPETNDRWRSFEALRQVEKELGLHELEMDPDRTRITKSEVEMMRESGDPCPRLYIHEAIKVALENKPSDLESFCKMLEVRGVEIAFNYQSTGRIAGTSFSYAGRHFSGSKIAKNCSWTALVKQGLDYERERDDAAARTRASCSDTTETRDASTTPAIGREQPAHGENAGTAIRTEPDTAKRDGADSRVLERAGVGTVEFGDPANAKNAGTAKPGAAPNLPDEPTELAGPDGASGKNAECTQHGNPARQPIVRPLRVDPVFLPGGKAGGAEQSIGQTRSDTDGQDRRNRQSNEYAGPKPTDDPRPDDHSRKIEIGGPLGERGTTEPFAADRRPEPRDVGASGGDDRSTLRDRELRHNSVDGDATPGASAKSARSEQGFGLPTPSPADGRNRAGDQRTAEKAAIGDLENARIRLGRIRQAVEARLAQLGAAAFEIWIDRKGQRKLHATIFKLDEGSLLETLINLWTLGWRILVRPAGAATDPEPLMGFESPTKRKRKKPPMPEMKI